MKNRMLFILVFSLFSYAQASAQLISLGFVKNCMLYKRTTFTDELEKKHFSLIQDKVETPANMVLAGASYYSNTKKEEVAAKGEIKILSLISETIKITEITFTNATYYNNYNDVFKQMVNFFNNQQSFKSKKYKTDVAKFSKDGISYYAYKNGEVPVILITDGKIEEKYFGN
jgi:hypothetical protein